MTAKLLFILSLISAGLAFLFTPIVFVAVLLFCAAFKVRYINRVPQQHTGEAIIEKPKPLMVQKVNRWFLMAASAVAILGLVDTLFFIVDPLASGSDIWGLHYILILQGVILLIGIPTVAVANSENQSVIMGKVTKPQPVYSTWLAQPKKTIDAPLLISTVMVAVITFGFWIFSITSLHGSALWHILIIDAVLTVVTLVLVAKLWQNFQQLT